MWGTPLDAAFERVDLRFIPTHVGNTWGDGGRMTYPPVHPHACGEHKYDSNGRPRQYGSSPRMWGTLLGRYALGLDDRFIPTHVGNTSVPARCLP